MQNKNPLGRSQLGNEIRDMFSFPKVKGENVKGHFFLFLKYFLLFLKVLLQRSIFVLNFAKELEATY